MHLSKDKCIHKETLVFRFPKKDLEMKQILSFQGLFYHIGMAPYYMPWCIPFISCILDINPWGTSS